MSNYSPKHTPTTYAEARETILKHGRTKRGEAYPTVSLGYQTTLEPRGVMAHGSDPLDAPAYAIRYHTTDVVTFYRGGMIALNHGGWVSTTTVLRWNMFTPRELRVRGVDILARRADRDPRIVVSRVRWDYVTSEYTGDVYPAPIDGSEHELFVSRQADRTTYLAQTLSRSTRLTTWALAPNGLVQAALAAS